MITRWAVAGVLLSLLGLAHLACLASTAHAQPSTEQVLTDAGLSADHKQRVMSGQFVNFNVGGVSDRDLSFAIAFLVKRQKRAHAAGGASGKS